MSSGKDQQNTEQNDDCPMIAVCLYCKSRLSKKRTVLKDLCLPKSDPAFVLWDLAINHLRTQCEWMAQTVTSLAADQFDVELTLSKQALKPEFVNMNSLGLGCIDAGLDQRICPWQTFDQIIKPNIERIEVTMNVWHKNLPEPTATMMKYREAQVEMRDGSFRTRPWCNCVSSNGFCALNDRNQSAGNWGGTMEHPSGTY